MFLDPVLLCDVLSEKRGLIDFAKMMSDIIEWSLHQHFSRLDRYSGVLVGLQ